MGPASWVALGAVVGCLANWILPGRFPGGLPAMVVAGGAGAFVGGAFAALLTHRGPQGIDGVTLAVAFAGATLLLIATHRAGHAEPGPR